MIFQCLYTHRMLQHQRQSLLRATWAARARSEQSNQLRRHASLSGPNGAPHAPLVSDIHAHVTHMIRAAYEASPIRARSPPMHCGQLQSSSTRRC